MNTAELREARLRALGVAETPVTPEQFSRAQAQDKDSEVVDQSATDDNEPRLVEATPALASSLVDARQQNPTPVIEYRVPDEHSRRRLVASINEAVAETVQASAMEARAEDASFSGSDATGIDTALDHAAAGAVAPASALSEEWACSACTYINSSPATLRCDMCGTRRVGASESSESALGNTAAGFESDLGGSGGGSGADGVRAPDQTRHERLVGGDNNGWSEGFRAFFDDLLAPAPPLPPRHSPVSGDPLFDGLLRWVLGGALLGGALGGGAAWARGAGAARVRGAAFDGAATGALTGAAVGLDRRLHGDLDDDHSDDDDDEDGGGVVAGGGGGGMQRNGEVTHGRYGGHSPSRFRRSGSDSGGLLFAGDLNEWSPPVGLRRRIRVRGGSRRRAPGGAAAGELVELIDMLERFHRPGNVFLSLLLLPPSELFFCSIFDS